ncbi:hypothetical protein POM88_025497 [Heracleum sosnowskyi]|uniref:Zinc finger LSD1-type domain-containing protein n=1 Tax=Heracleum sosnowskyi TaxID=360622 RepID=A0AAD8MNX3_9APIA|nr:hypothetical protein POM88_025497 [Heracleum sosnowskyi]
MVEDGTPLVVPPDWEMVETEEPRPPTPPTPSLPFSPTQDIHMKIEQLEVQEEDEEEEDDGPPPGWNIIPQLQTNAGNKNMDDDDDEGPPPGWDFMPKREQLSGHKNKGIEEDSQPTGWHFVSLPELERENDHQDIEEDGPPPGWPSMPQTKRNIMIDKKEIEVGTELGAHVLPSPQIRMRCELEAVEAKEIGIQHETSSIDLLQPLVEYKQGNEEAQPGMNPNLLPQSQVTSPMVPPLPLRISDTDIKCEQEVADEEGPPGWHSVEPNKTNSEQEDIKEGVSCGWTSPEKTNTELQKDMIIEQGAEEGPPPGWNSIGKNNIDSEHQDVKEGASHGRTSPEKNKTELEKQDILGAVEEGPPPGWHSIQKDKISSEHQDIKGASHAFRSPEKPKTELEKQDTVDEGPPPGWNHMTLPQSKIGNEHQEIKIEGSPHDLHLDPPSLPKLDSIKVDIGEETPQSMPNSVCQQPKMGHGQQEVKEERFQPGSNSMPPPSPQIQPPMPTTTPLSTASRRPTQSGSHIEMCQMVCGSCRRLLSYARGAKYVKCSCCQTVNLVLEAHQVGQVKCGGCEVLLMYQFGANAVQCASCRHVTEIVVQNRRPPLSLQQARGRRHGISTR